MLRYEYEDLKFVFFTEKEFDDGKGGIDDALILDEVWEEAEQIHSIKDFIKCLLGMTDYTVYVDEFEWNWVFTKKVFDLICLNADSIERVSDGEPVDPEKYWLHIDYDDLDNDLVSLEEPIFIEFESYKILFYYSFSVENMLYAVPKMKLIER
tara:strand:- start:203 stop:661 length:459 start_codon:yes stop_codon:yes gene_type:complete